MAGTSNCVTANDMVSEPCLVQDSFAVHAVSVSLFARESSPLEPVRGAGLSVSRSASDDANLGYRRVQVL